MNAASSRPAALFPRLQGGPGGLGREEVARNQRARLSGAMVAALARHGYAATTMIELVGLAGVSKRTFYEHFASKDECFLATYDDLVAQAGKRIGAAYISRQGSRERLEAALEAAIDFTVEHPEAAKLVLVDSLSLGAAAAPNRNAPRRAWSACCAWPSIETPGRVRSRRRRAGRWSAARAGSPTATCEAGGRRPCASTARRCWSGRSRYRGPSCPTLPKPALSPFSRLHGRLPPRIGPSRQPPRPPHPSQHERIVRAAGRLAAAKGYGALSIPAIAAEAGVANRTFYEHFDSKEAAFLAAFDAQAQRALAIVLAAFRAQSRWPEAIAAALEALLHHIAADRVLAALAFTELVTAGPGALDRADAAQRNFTTLLDPDLFGTSVPQRPADCVVEAISGGIFTAIAHEIAAGRGAELPRLAPEVTRLALTPFGVV